MFLACLIAEWIRLVLGENKIINRFIWSLYLIWLRKLAKLSSEYQIAPFIYLIEVWLINIHFMFRSNLFLSLFFLCSLIRKSGEIDDENADRLKEKLKPIKILRGVFIGLTVIGCAMILISIIIFASRWDCIARFQWLLLFESKIERKTESK